MLLGAPKARLALAAAVQQPQAATLPWPSRTPPAPAAPSTCPARAQQHGIPRDLRAPTAASSSLKSSPGSPHPSCCLCSTAWWLGAVFCYLFIFTLLRVGWKSIDISLTPVASFGISMEIGWRSSKTGSGQLTALGWRKAGAPAARGQEPCPAGSRALQGLETPPSALPEEPAQLEAGDSCTAVNFTSSPSRADLERGYASNLPAKDPHVHISAPPKTSNTRTGVPSAGKPAFSCFLLIFPSLWLSSDCF